MIIISDRFFLTKRADRLYHFGYDEYVLADKMYRHGNEVIMRVGMGYDVHRLVPDRDLIIGGVKIPYEKGLLGHSDADVLLHAIMDALLGAAALGDIGKHFPDNDPEYEGADSLALLKRVGELLSEEGYVIENIDSTIIAQKPKMAPHIEQMRKNIADTLGLDITRVNVKATTEEGLGFTGTGEGISSQAVVLIMSVENYIYDNIARGQFISSDAPAGGCAGCQGCRKNG
jgi:2-C-methyl-D-erythritol 2,4-cyclodiphosphate synthase